MVSRNKYQLIQISAGALLLIITIFVKNLPLLALTAYEFAVKFL